MAKRKLRNYKNYDFNSKEDYLFAANTLITVAYRALDKYKYYEKKLEEYQEKIVREGLSYIDSNEYEEWTDKQQNVTHALLKCFVDDTTTGFSYVMFRRFINRTQYAQLLDPLDEKVKSDLNELRDVRNWTFHFAQSDFVAMKETTYFGVPDELKQYIVFRPNPIIVGRPQKISAVYIDSLIIHMERRIEVFERILNSMKKDYESLLGEKVEIVDTIESPQEYGGVDMMNAQLSMAMQKVKYDGSKESFENITLRNVLNKYD